MKKGLIIFLVLSDLFVFGQQVPQYTQWSWHQMALNPAHAGIKKCVDIHTLARTQWVGFEGAPKSGLFTLSVPLNSKRKQFLSARHGLGLKFEKDAIGQFDVNRINAAYAAHFNFNVENRLSLGVYAGAVQMGYNPSQVTTTVPDPVAQNEGSFVAPDASFGAWYNSTNYYIGFTMQQLIPNKWNGIGEQAKNRIHNSISAGYQYGVNSKLSLLPALLLKFPPRGTASFDLSLQMDYQNVLGVGLGYRSSDALLVFFQLKIKEQFSVGYTFDYTLSKIQVGAQNTHEVSLRFTSCKPQKNASYSCPLFD